MDESLQGGSELVPAGGARCATHPDVRATATCDRCGNFVCNACYDVLPDGRAVCAPCHALVGNLSIPWERADLPWLKRFGRTVTEVVLTPGMTLGRIGEGDAWRPVSFLVTAALTSALLLIVLVLLSFALVPQRMMDVTGSPEAPLWAAVGAACYAVSAPFVLAGIVLIVGAALHGAARAVGGQGTWATSLRATAYMGAMWPAVGVLNLFGVLPVVGFVPQIVALGLMLLWPPVALHEVAKGVHGLSGIKAVAVAFFPLVALTAMGCLCLIPAALLDT
jgi:hypothetical protein